MKRLGILTAGGDTPALNATLHDGPHRSTDTYVNKRLRHLADERPAGGA